MPGEAGKDRRERIHRNPTEADLVGHVLEVVVAQIAVEDVVVAELALGFRVGWRSSELISPIADVDVEQPAPRRIGESHASDDVTDRREPRTLGDVGEGP